MKNILILLSIILILSSCSEDFFDSTINVTPPEHVDQMAISAIFTNQDSSLYVNVSKSTAILENTNPDRSNLDDATVILSQGETIISDMVHENVEYFNYKGAVNGNIFEPGKTYQLEVDHSLYPKAVATATMPNTVPLSSTSVKFDNDAMYSWDREDEITLEFNDPAGEENFYEATVYIKYKYFGLDNPEDTVVYYNLQYIDESVEYNDAANYGGIIFSDELFDGEKHEVKFKVGLDGINDFSEYESRSLHLIWRTVSKDYYEFSKGVISQDFNDGNPFASPVTIRSTFDNGLGIFTIHNERVYQLY